jgi:glycine/D-amino acid oxidase-like deaminating enzyme/nitrite reductase/ring-hydroxylating ferredoxin subunit
MNVYAEQSRSIWMDPPAIEAPVLERDTRADVLVIGSGIAGLSCAYELASAGRHVTVIDRGPIARGMTARTSAHLSYELDDHYFELLKLRGDAEARQYFDSQRAAVARIEQISAQEQIDCDFARVEGYLCAQSAADRVALEAELAACHRVGFNTVHWAESPIPGTGALRFEAQARFHPVKYLDGLARTLMARGAVLYAHSPAVDFDEHRVAVRVTLANGAGIVASQVIVATNSPISTTVTVHTKQAPYRTYVIAAPVPSRTVPDALIWDTGDPYHYVRLQPGPTEDLVLIGGEDHKTGIENDGAERIERLHAWGRSRWPQLGPIRHAWSGQVYEPVDVAPYIGRAAGTERIFLVSGDSGEGLTTGAAAGMILRDLLMGRPSAWSQVYEPDRKTLRAARTYLEENLDVAANFTEHVHDTHHLQSLDDVPRGGGAIVSLEGRKVAAYRNEEGELQLRSASCTHVGCIVHWNSFERCWDCPCHGSQFAVTGEPLTGPAMKPLAPVRR